MPVSVKPLTPYFSDCTSKILLTGINNFARGMNYIFNKEGKGSKVFDVSPC